MPARTFPSIASLTDPDALTAIVGHVDDVRVEPFGGVGFSNSSLSRVIVNAGSNRERGFVLKHTDLERDWTAWRTGDLAGREARLLMEPALADVWDVYACPYVASAIELPRIGLLLDDLTSSLMPDVREPLTRGQEHALLAALARLHARYWNDPAVDLPWLARPAGYCDVVAPAIARDDSALAMLPPGLRTNVSRGWTLAEAHLPPSLMRLLTCSGTEWQTAWADLPRTLVHGDVKVANFAVLADGRVAAFDWTMMGAGPCGIDLGWYLGVNASRLTMAKDAIVRRYRGLLEDSLGYGIGEETWHRLEEVAAVCGARMLLWSKALGVEAGRAGAQEDWDWWVGRLEAVQS